MLRVHCDYLLLLFSIIKTISKSVGFNFSPQKYSFLTATEIYFIGGGKYYPGIPMTLKCVKQFERKSDYASAAGTGFALKPGKWGAK